MRDFAAKYAGKSASTDDFRELSEKVYGEKLTWFYSQWMDSTSAPEFKAKYTVYRLGNNKGFRIVGAITQDLDLFRMPVVCESIPTEERKRNALRWWAPIPRFRWKPSDARDGFRSIPKTAC
jgi:aminopeptidase N